ncbi:unnamed protein product [Allacma fusca]|uniref:Uncharacterized protein n=1 Tax=Allacma fusca TaxID=39272 RepID=A0A8J2NQJ8_9HEXA|nr:unnamed protein product [Allacma fusca]
MDPERVKLNESRILVNGFQNSTGEIKTRRNVLLNQMESHGTHQHQPLIAQFLKKRKVDTQQTGSSVCDGRSTPGISKGDRYERHNAPAEYFKNVVTEAILGGNSNDSEMNNGCNEVDQPMSEAALAESPSNIVDASCSDDITGKIEADRTESSTHQGYSLETVDIISDEEKQADYCKCNYH